MVNDIEKEYDKLDHTTDSGKDYDSIIILEGQERILEKLKQQILNDCKADFKELLK